MEDHELPPKKRHYSNSNSDAINDSSTNAARNRRGVDSKTQSNERNSDSTGRRIGNTDAVPVSKRRRPDPSIQSTIRISDLNNPIASKKKKQSYFKAYLTTINTNRRFENGDPEQEKTASVLKEVLTLITTEPEEVKAIVGKDYKTKEARIEKIESEFVLEKAPETLCLHAHGIITIKSKNRSHLGYVKFRQNLETLFRTKLKEAGLTPTGNLYIKHEELHELEEQLNSKERIMDYIAKNILHTKKEEESEKSEESSDEEEDSMKTGSVPKYSRKTGDIDDSSEPEDVAPAKQEKEEVPNPPHVDYPEKIRTFNTTPNLILNPSFDDLDIEPC